MKILVAAFITALLVFTLATAWVEVVQPRLDLMAMATAAKANESAVKSPSKQVQRREAPNDDEFDPVGELPPTTRNSAKSTRNHKSREDSAAIAVQERLLEQLADVRQKEAKVAEREDTLLIICDDIRREIAEFEDARRQSSADVAGIDRRLLESTLKQAGGHEGDSEPVAKRKARAEDRIASTIEYLAANGNVGSAASLLSGMKDRSVAKVLQSLSQRDPQLAIKLSDQIQTVKRDTVIRR